MARFERAAVLVFALAPVAACSVLAGLDGFQKTSCDEPCADAPPPPELNPEGGAVPEAGGDERPVNDGTMDDEGSVEGNVPDAADASDGAEGGDSGPDAEGGVSIDRTWARWVMPNPAASGDAEAGAPLPNPAQYDTSAEDIVRDLVTGLVWKNASASASSLQQAMSACAAPWRVPTRIEVVSILDTTRPSPPYANPAFSFSSPAPELWTSSTTPGGGSWSVSFSTGEVTPPSLGHPSAVLCVQGGA